MNNFLRKINLIEDVQFELQTSKTDFIRKFKQNVENSDLGFNFFEGFEAFSSNKQEYKGYINDRKFEIQKRRKLFEPNQTFAIARGTFNEMNDKLNFKIEINAFRKIMFLFLGFILVFYGGFLSFFIFGDAETPFFILPFLLVHSLFMIGIPYFLMRRSVKKMQYDLERDFHYWLVKH